LSITKINGYEQELIKALQAIVAETMDYPPVIPKSTASYLPPHLVEQAQAALRAYSADIAESMPALRSFDRSCVIGVDTVQGSAA